MGQRSELMNTLANNLNPSAIDTKDIQLAEEYGEALRVALQCDEHRVEVRADEDCVCIQCQQCCTSVSIDASFAHEFGTEKVEYAGCPFCESTCWTYSDVRDKFLEELDTDDEMTAEKWLEKELNR